MDSAHRASIRHARLLRLDAFVGALAHMYYLTVCHSGELWTGRCDGLVSTGRIAAGAKQSAALMRK